MQKPNGIRFDLKEIVIKNTNTQNKKNIHNE